MPNNSFLIPKFHQTLKFAATVQVRSGNQKKDNKMSITAIKILLSNTKFQLRFCPSEYN